MIRLSTNVKLLIFWYIYNNLVKFPKNIVCFLLKKLNKTKIIVLFTTKSRVMDEKGKR